VERTRILSWFGDAADRFRRDLFDKPCLNIGAVIGSLLTAIRSIGYARLRKHENLEPIVEIGSGLNAARRP